MRRPFRRLAFLLALLAAHAAPARAGWSSIGDVSAVEPLAQGVLLRAGESAVAATALSPQILRLRYAPDGRFPREHSWAVVRRDFGPVDAQVIEAADHVDLLTSGLRLRVERAPLRLRVLDADGRRLVVDDAERGLSHAGAAVRAAWRLDDTDHVYGLGEKTGPLDKRGRNLGGSHYAMWNTDAPAWDASTDPLYVSVPFLLVLRGGRAHGVFLDNAWRSHFDIGRDARGLLQFGAEGGGFDVYVIDGPDPKAVIERYTALTGRTPLPPRWALGYQQSRWSYTPEARVRRLAETFRARRVPADGLWLDIDYQQDFRPFTWDAARFPAPGRLLAELAAQGFHVVTIVDPHPPCEAGYALYDAGLAGGHFLRRADGSLFSGPVWPSQAAQHAADSVFPDFTRAATRAWWGEQYGPFLDLGVAGIWNDMNEPAVWGTPDGTLPADVIHDNDGEPADHRAVHNVYGMQFSRATFEGLQRLRPDARPFVLTRASFAGGQRYAAVWTGDNTADWASLRQSLPMLMNLGVSGFAFVGADVGGFVGAPSGELFARWLQAALFSPFLRAHTEARTPDQEPWSYGEAWEAVNRRSIELRYRLLPTLYNAMEEAARRGVPALRPLFLEFPDDPASAGRDDEMLLGADLLLAPVLAAGATQREVYLPPGAWFDFWTGQPLAGGSTHTLAVTPESVPLFVRGGAFVFLQPVVQHTGAMAGQPLTVQVYPAADSRGAQYEDDGASLAYARGGFARRSFRQHRDAAGIALQADAVAGRYRGAPRALRFALIGAATAQGVELDGRALPRRDGEAFERASAAWTVRDGAVWVSLRDRRVAFRLFVRTGAMP